MDIVTFDDPYGRRRKFGYINCDTCREFYFERLDRIFNKKYNKHYCSKECQKNRESTKTLVEFQCAFCSKLGLRNPNKFKNSKSGLFFCNRLCKDSAQKMGGIAEIMPPHYGTGTANYRKLAFESFEPKCNICGYNKYSAVLDVHHKDKNRENNDIDNLEFLCPTCHREVHYLDGSGQFYNKKL